MAAIVSSASPGIPARDRRRRPTGPHLGALALISLALTVASLISPTRRPTVHEDR